MRGFPTVKVFFVQPQFLSIGSLQHKHPFVKYHLFKPEVRSCCQLMSAFRQVSSARQQSINCLQLAEFPTPRLQPRPISGLDRRNGEGFAVATAPLHLVYTLHTLLAAFVRLLKNYKSEAQLASAAAVQDVMSP